MSSRRATACRQPTCRHALAPHPDAAVHEGAGGEDHGRASAGQILHATLLEARLVTRRCEACADKCRHTAGISAATLSVAVRSSPERHSKVGGHAKGLVVAVHLHPRHHACRPSQRSSAVSRCHLCAAACALAAGSPCRRQCCCSWLCWHHIRWHPSGLRPHPPECPAPAALPAPPACAASTPPCRSSGGGRRGVARRSGAVGISHET